MREEQPPHLPSSMGGGRRGNNALQTGLFPPLLYSEGAVFCIIDSSVQSHFSGTNPLTPKLSLYYLEINILIIIPLEKSLKTKIYSRGGINMYIDLP